MNALREELSADLHRFVTGLHWFALICKWNENYLNLFQFHAKKLFQINAYEKRVIERTERMAEQPNQQIIVGLQQNWFRASLA